MPFLTLEDIAAAGNKLVTETVPAPEWGGDLLVRMLSASERIAFYVRESERQKAAKADGTVDTAYMARFLVLCLCDQAGARLYADDQADWLNALPSGGAVIERAYDVACRLNKMFRHEDQQLKNSAATLSA